MAGRLWLKGGGGGDGGGDGWMIDNDYRSRRWIDVFYFISRSNRCSRCFVPSSFAFSRFDFCLSIGGG